MFPSERRHSHGKGEKKRKKKNRIAEAHDGLKLLLR